MSDWEDPYIPCRRRGKQLHPGGDVCGIVLLGSTVLSVFYHGNPTGRELSVPAGTLMFG